VLLPFAAGALAYDAESNDAQAAGVDPVNAKMRGVAAGIGAAALTAGAAKAAPYVAEAAGKSLLGRVALRAFPPAMGALTAYDVGSSVLGGLAQGKDVAGADADLRSGNRGFQGRQEDLRRQAYRRPAAEELPNAAALQIPEGIPAPNPDGSSPYGQADIARARQDAPAPSSNEAIAARARARQGMQAQARGNAWEEHLQAFLDAIDQHNEGIGGEQPAYGP
jgi:hypothetical protein